MKKKLLWGLVWRSLFFVSNFIFNIAVTRYFGVQESGTLYYIINNLSFFILISTINIETGIGYYGAIVKYENTGPLLVIGLLFTTFSTAVLLFILQFTGLFHFFSDSSWPLYFSFIFVVGNIIVSIISALLYAQNNYVLPNLILSISTFIVSGIYLISNKTHSLNHNQSLNIYFWYNLLQGILLLLAFAFTLKNKSIWEKMPLIKIKEIITYSFVALVNNIFFFLLYRMDFWFVKEFNSTSQLGNYVQVSKFGQLLLVAPIIFSSIIQPRITDGSIKKYDKTAALAFTVIIIGGVLSFLFILVFGTLFFEGLLGKEFNKMYLPTLFKIPAIVLLSFQFILGTWFSAINKVHYNLYCTLVGVVIIVIADYLLIPIYGIVGASLASFIAYFAVFITAAFIYHYKTSQSLIALGRQIVYIILNLKKETVIILKSFN